MEKLRGYDVKVQARRAVYSDSLRIQVYLALVLTIVLLTLLAFLSDAGYAHADGVYDETGANRIERQVLI